MEPKKIPIVVTAEEQAAYDWICISNKRMEFLSYLKKTRLSAGRQLTYEAFGKTRQRNDTALTRWVRASAVTFHETYNTEPLPANEQAAAH